jgi:hypothetical protein
MQHKFESRGCYSRRSARWLRNRQYGQKTIRSRGIRRLRLPSRIVMSSMSRDRSPGGAPTALTAFLTTGAGSSRRRSFRSSDRSLFALRMSTAQAALPFATSARRPRAHLWRPDLAVLALQYMSMLIGTRKSKHYHLTPEVARQWRSREARPCGRLAHRKWESTPAAISAAIPTAAILSQGAKERSTWSRSVGTSSQIMTCRGA